MRELHHQISVLQAELVHTIGEFDATGAYELDEYRSTQSWLRYQLRIHPREASHLVGAARQLRQLPAVDQAFTAGEITAAHVAVITRTARQVGADHLAESEDLLVAVARTHDPEKLRTAAQRLR
jgi:hypothetical protein